MYYTCSLRTELKYRLTFGSAFIETLIDKSVNVKDGDFSSARNRNIGTITDNDSDIDTLFYSILFHSQFDGLNVFNLCFRCACCVFNKRIYVYYV